MFTNKFSHFNDTKSKSYSKLKWRIDLRKISDLKLVEDHAHFDKKKQTAKFAK